jgi:copper chaperone CopZ
MQAMQLKISGMNCGHCVAAVREALSNVAGVEVDDVSIGSASLRVDSAKVSRDDIVDAIEDEGYEVVE